MHNEAWNLCIRSRHIGTSGLAAVPIIQPLLGYTRKITRACGPNVYKLYLTKVRSCPNNAVSDYCMQEVRVTIGLQIQSLVRKNFLERK